MTSIIHRVLVSEPVTATIAECHHILQHRELYTPTGFQEAQMEYIHETMRSAAKPLEFAQFCVVVYTLISPVYRDRALGVCVRANNWFPKLELYTDAYMKGVARVGSAANGACTAAFMDHVRVLYITT